MYKSIKYKKIIQNNKYTKYLDHEILMNKNCFLFKLILLYNN